MNPNTSRGIVDCDAV